MYRIGSGIVALIILAYLGYCFRTPIPTHFDANYFGNTKTLQVHYELTIGLDDCQLEIASHIPAIPSGTVFCSSVKRDRMEATLRFSQADDERYRLLDLNEWQLISSYETLNHGWYMTGLAIANAPVPLFWKMTNRVLY